MLETLCNPGCSKCCENANANSNLDVRPTSASQSKGKNEFSNSGTTEQVEEAPGVSWPFAH